jgi:hypothetical protein
MRTRIRSHAQHLTGRRRRVARRPPDEELVLQLQHSIGNRATTRLLRERLMSRFHMDLGTFRRELMADNICPRL